ncbi:nucleoside 2-deoxyribosyltransferase [Endozoicomonas sp. OPT23]|uniref:nucleoside 2-deoxyribosyltransferase n=1 Tax=Endozoicomonas sp. OPT23 TaxID=2072845 RepID=UPI00189126C2|nr:nucleoside 2-deoxyribosyltransferase [Endozoicomonas sp. OPT23]
MKKVYFGIKYHSDNRNRELIEQFEAKFKALGWSSYCVVRDLEKWGDQHFEPDTIMADTFAKIDGSDLVVIDVSEKGIGLGIEAGYARAKGIPLVVTLKEGVEVSTTVLGTADRVIHYNDVADIDFSRY